MKGESWKFKLMADICAAMNRSGNKQDFIFEMERCSYQVKWTDERKYITFTCPNRMKCRDIKLHDDKYLKENLEYELLVQPLFYPSSSAFHFRKLSSLMACSILQASSSASFSSTPAAISWRVKNWCRS